MRWRAAAAALCAFCACPLMPTGLAAIPNGLAAPAVGGAGWIAGTAGCAAGPADTQRERDRRELKAFAAGMAPRHAREYFDELRRRARRRARAERQQRGDTAPPLWPGIIEDSARWLDKRPAEREELRRRERAEQGVGSCLVPACARPTPPLACAGAHPARPRPRWGWLPTRGSRARCRARTNTGRARRHVARRPDPL